MRVNIAKLRDEYDMALNALIDAVEDTSRPMDPELEQRFMSATSSYIGAIESALAMLHKRKVCR
jgi:hypothetical protein